MAKKSKVPSRPREPGVGTKQYISDFVRGYGDGMMDKMRGALGPPRGPQMPMRPARPPRNK
jgi:hypothetical protein